MIVMAVVDGDAIWLPVLPEVTGWDRTLKQDIEGPVEKASKDAGEKGGNRLVDGFKNAAKKAGVAAGAAVGALVAKGFYDALNDGNSVARMNAAMGLSPQNAAKAGQAARNLYREAYGASVDETASAVEAVMTSVEGMADAPMRDIEKLTAKMIDMSKVFDTDVAQAAAVAGNAVKLGVVGSLDEGLDYMTATMQKVPVFLRGEAIDAMGEYLPHLANAGVVGGRAFEVIASSVQAMTYGIDGSGDAVKELITKTIEMADPTRAAFEAIGLDADAMSNAIAVGGHAADEAVSKISNALLGVNDPAERARMALAIFGTPVETIGLHQLPQFLEALNGTKSSLGEVEGAAQRMGETLNGTPATALEGFKRTLMGAFTDGAGSFIQGLQNIETEAEGGFLTTVNELGLGVRGVFEWAVEHKEDIVAFGKDVAIIALAFAAYEVAVVGTAVGAKLWSALLPIMSGQTNILAIAQAKLNAMWLANPIGLVVGAIIGLVAIFAIAWNHSETFRQVVTAAWDGIKNAALWAWENVLKPVFGALTSGLDIIGAAAKIMGDAVVFAFGWLWDNGIKPVWQFVEPVFKAMGDWISKVLPDAFKLGVGDIGSMWDSLREKLSKPINWVIRNVYNDGIAKIFNGIAKTVGSDTRMPVVNELGSIGGTNASKARGNGRISAYAKGGFAHPGWALVGEEGPELIDLKTPGRVYTASETRAALNGGHSDQTGDGVGILDKIGGWVSNAVSNVTDFLSNPLGAITGLADRIWNASGLGGNAWATLAKDTVLSPFKQAGDFLANTFGMGGQGSAAGAGSGSGVGGWQWQVDVLKRQFGDRARITSTYRPGAVTALGNRSNHGKGLAVDIGGYELMDIYNFLYSKYGRSSLELLYSHPGAVNRSLYHGKPYQMQPVTRQMHRNHIHWAFPRMGGAGPTPTKYDSGGWLQPGHHATANLTKRPEPVLTHQQWQDVSTLAKRGAISAYGQYAGEHTFVIKDQDGALIGRMRGEAAGVTDKALAQEASWR